MSESEYIVKRPSVENLLLEAFKKPLTTVTAGAGYGKTQAVLAALRRSCSKSMWLQLSELDNYISRFWNRIAASFKEHSQNLYKSLEALGYPESIAAFDQFLRLLSKLLPEEEHFVLVLDDFHLILNKNILNFIELFISACVENISIVLISRKKPELSLSGMLSKGLLARICEDDLRFSKEETKEYFSKKNIALSENVAEDIYNYTDGWIFAIYLVGLSAQKENNNPILTAKIDIFELMEKEVFSAASKELQSFLVKISALNAIPSALLKEIAADCPELISEMLQMSLFVRYDSSADGYRIHHLFKEFLLDKKNMVSREDFCKVYLTAASFYKNNGHKTEALDYYKKCNCYYEIFDIIRSYPHHIEKESAELLIAEIDSAPKEVLDTRPIMKVVKANLLFNNNRIEESKQILLTLRKEYEALPKTEENLALLGEVYITLGLICVVNLDYEFEKLFKMADECLPNSSQLIDPTLYIAEGLNICTIKEPTAGELERHKQAIFNVAPYASKVMNKCGYGLEYLNAAESSLYNADLKSAEKYAYEAIYRSRQYKQYDVEYMANFVLVRIFTARGSYKKLFDILAQMKKQLDELQIPKCISLYDVIKGWVYVKIGKPEKISKWIKYEEETRKMLAPIHIGREYLVRSDCLLAEERYYELLAFMKQTDKIYEERGILFAIIQNKITKAIIDHYTGNYESSMKAFSEAYELAHPNDLTMQFIEYGNRMRTLIYSARNNKDCVIPKKWLDKIYTKSSSYAKMLSQIVVEYEKSHKEEEAVGPSLSKRQQEVLSCLYRGMTREEIASTCYLSISSINSTLKNIYDKLGANNMVDAIRIAKERNLI